MSIESSRGRILPPDLDDRNWQDLVDEMQALIPTYAPQWTDQNPSDLGISLIELFAWLTEQLIYRLNQVPQKNYIAFLNLLGITRNPPVPAHTYLTFTAAPTGGPGPVTVPAGTQAQTPAAAGQSPVVFETDEAATVQPANLTHAVLVTAGHYQDLSSVLVGPPAGKYLLDVAAGSAVQLCLGFDAQLAGPFQLDLRFYLPNAATTALLALSYSQAELDPTNWPPLPAAGVLDGTQALSHDGGVQLTVPSDWTHQRPSGAAAGPAADWAHTPSADPNHLVTDQVFWIGLQVSNPATAPTPLQIGIDRLLFNSAQARSAVTIRSAEELGRSTGAAFQVFPLKNGPLYLASGPGDPYAGMSVEVGAGTPPVWQPWTRVDDLPAGPGEVCRVDPVSAEVSFGNYDARTPDGHGSIPDSGSTVRISGYRYIDTGAAANVAAGTLVSLGTTLDSSLPAGVTAVTNLGPGLDGTDEEAVEDTLARAPEELKIRDRAVTADDFEFLAQEASPDVHAACCLPPRLQIATTAAWQAGDPWAFAGINRAPGNVNLIIVPDQGAGVGRPEPTPEQFQQVVDYLDARRDVTAHLQVLGPRYLPVIVTVTLVLWQTAGEGGPALQALVEADVRARISAFLHPTAGGPQGTGWQVGQNVFTSDLFQAIMPSPDVGYIATLLIRPDTPAYHFPPINPTGTVSNYNPDVERPFKLSADGASVRAADYELICDGVNHSITSSQLPR